MVKSPYLKIDLTTFFLSVSSAAYMGMGFTPDETAMAPKLDLELARQNIDLLELMEEKTRGNRNADEDQLIMRLLFETRMKYIETEKKIKKNG